MSINATLFIQLIVFFIGAMITMKFIWPPLIGALEERQKKIADGLAAGERGKQDLLAAEKRAQEADRAARDRAQEILAQSEKRAAAVIEEASSSLTLGAGDIARVEAGGVLAITLSPEARA